MEQMEQIDDFTYDLFGIGGLFEIRVLGYIGLTNPSEDEKQKMYDLIFQSFLRVLKSSGIRHITKGRTIRIFEHEFDEVYERLPRHAYIPGATLHITKIKSGTPLSRVFYWCEDKGVYRIN